MSERFAQFLKTRIGLDVQSVGEAAITRAVRNRSGKVCGGDVHAYWMHLQTSEEEQQTLIDAVIVPETWFFRYPESFAVLAQLAGIRARQLAAERPLRLLSLPCSTGEEPYSMVMALLDAGLPAESFEVDALDISPVLLDRAAEGRYRRNSFRGEQQGFRERHFGLDGQDYQLSERVRRKVRFRCGNLLAADLLAGEPAYDFVFCRNLLIYFDRATQERAVQVLRRLVRKDGALFIGPAEATLLYQTGMRPLGVEQSFAFRHKADDDAPVRAQVAPPTLRLPPARPVPRAAPAAPPAIRLESAAPRVQERNPPAQRELEEIAALANRGQVAQARECCAAHLSRHGPSADVYYWLGLLCDAERQTDEAQAHYRKALYLQPGHQEALLQLAALLAARGDADGARRLLERAARGVS